MNTFRILFLCLPTWYLCSNLSAQSYHFDSTSVPRPEIGWVAIQKSIKYSNIAERAGLQGLYYVDVQIDTYGNVVAIKDSSVPEIFRIFIERAIRSTKWIPGSNVLKPLVTEVRIPLLFYLNEGNPPLLIEGLWTAPQKTSHGN